MMIAFMSDVFIGTRGSSFAADIGVKRVLRGANPESSFIYVKWYKVTKEGNKTQEEVIEICEEWIQNHMSNYSTVVKFISNIMIARKTMTSFILFYPLTHNFCF